ncbi:MAG: hypothetical protein FJ029_14640 [Actinobacteria bacterium]|nr:hypothetical protein [Actinomycetota bacterium]
MARDLFLAGDHGGRDDAFAAARAAAAAYAADGLIGSGWRIVPAWTMAGHGWRIVASDGAPYVTLDDGGA